jgi:cytochrome c2
MKNSGITWNSENLQAFVRDPGKTVPKPWTIPASPTPSAKAVAYLATLK